MTPIVPEVAARAMFAHNVAAVHTCWLRAKAGGLLEGCPIGALYFDAHGTIVDARQIIDWAAARTDSAHYVSGFDDGFHGFAPSAPHTTDYAAGLADGLRTRVLVDTGLMPALNPPLFRPVDSSEHRTADRS